MDDATAAREDARQLARSSQKFSTIREAFFPRALADFIEHFVDLRREVGRCLILPTDSESLKTVVLPQQLERFDLARAAEMG